MKLSDAGRRLLSIWEGGPRLRAYPDSGKPPVLTIGIGHALTKSERASGEIWIFDRHVFYKDGLTPIEARLLFDQDIAPVEALVSHVVDPSAPALSPPQFDALVAFAFNIGDEAFARPERDPPGSNVLRVVNAGHFADVPAALAEWVYDNHQKVKGLVNRRALETALWNSDPRLDLQTGVLRA